MNALDRDTLGAVLQPVSGARGLPNNFYIDAGTFEEEKRRVFFDNWAGIGFAKDIPEPADARPIDFLGQPLLAVRDREGSVRVFQNACRHRGMILVDGPCRLRGMIRCKYHSWVYALDGELRSTPHVGGPGNNLHEGIDRASLGLVEIRSHVWRDVIFVNVSGDAPDFETHASALIERWRDFDRPLFHGGADSSFRLDVATNWKLAVENYCESYHLPWVHPGLNSYSRLEDHYHIIEQGRYAGQGTEVYNPSLGDGSLRFSDFADLPARWDSAAEYVAFFPNVLFGIHRDHAYAILLEPTGLESTAEQIEIYYADEAMTGPEYASLRAENATLWKGIFVEDIGVVEGMQKGRHALAFDGGKFSPVMDEPTHAFHHWVASRFAGGG